jgi:preprotein translocase subunit YajC
MSRRIPLAVLLASSTVASVLTPLAHGEDGGPGGTPAPGPGGTSAPAPGAPGAPGAKPAASPFDPTFFIFLIGAVLFMYFLIIRPQRKDEARRKELVNGMKAGHKVITIGGLHAEVAAIGENTVDLKVGDVVMTFNKSAVSTNVSLAGDKAVPAK